MIDIQDITFGYDAGGPLVFDGFSLQLEPGRVYGLLGENGTGKSTLLYLIMGLLRPSQGQVTLAGTDTSLRRQPTLEELYIVPEEFSMPPLPFADYVETYRPFYPRFSSDVLKRCMEEFHLAPDANLAQLSMGDRKKALMSFALATNASYLLMDEPTNGLDLPSKKQFRKVVAGCMDDNRTVLVATHQLHDVEQLLDHVLILQRSSLLVNQPVTALSEQYTFDVRPDEALSGEDVLYHERTVQGNATLSRRQPGDAETPLNLELLFNAAISNRL